MKNRYEVRGEVTAIHVRSTKLKTWMECLIDTADLPALLELRVNWYANPARKDATKHYANAKLWTPATLIERGRMETLMMHRVVMSAEPGSEVHHVDNDGLNNRRSNLQFVSHRENIRAIQPEKNWPEFDRRMDLAEEYRRERDIARQVQSQFDMTRQGLWKIRNGSTRGLNAAKAYRTACAAAGVRTFQQITAAHPVAPGCQFGAMRGKGLPRL
jgi:hypothetical protein